MKLGIGTPAEQIETIAAIRARYAGTIRIDANEGWNVESAVSILRELERYEIEFCEQPIPAGHPERTARDSRARFDSDRRRRRCARRKRSCTRCAAASTASTSSSPRPAAFAARSR